MSTDSNEPEALGRLGSGAMFGTGRSSALGGRLKPPNPIKVAAPPKTEPATTPNTSTSPSAIEEVTPAASAPPHTPAPAIRVTPPAPSPDKGVGPQTHVVHVAEQVVDAWRRRKIQDRLPLTAVALRAIEDRYSRLGDLFPQTTAGGLFEVQTRHGRTRPPAKREQVSLRLTPNNLATLDSLCQEHGVSRSDLVETTLADYLGVTI